MRAVVIISHSRVDGIGVLEVESPSTPMADRVRVRVRAAGLNRADILQRRGHYPAPPGYPQDIPGMEFAGEVEALGKDARAWQFGDRVFGITAVARKPNMLPCRKTLSRAFRKIWTGLRP